MAGNINSLDAINLLVNASANFDYTVTRGYEVVDIVSTQNATAGGAATVTPQRIPSGGSPSALGAAMTVTTGDKIVYASTIIDAQATFAAGDTLRMVGDRNDMAASVSVSVLPTSWIAG